MRQRADGSRDAVIATQHVVAPSHVIGTVNQQQVAVLTRDVVYTHHQMAAASRAEEGSAQTHNLVCES